MAERVLRGSRLGSVSYENERSQEPAARRRIAFDCPTGHHFSRVFAEEADLPATWECPQCGRSALAVNAARPEPKKIKPTRTHWDMLMERRTTAELQVLLDERLAELRGHGGAPQGRRSA
jgi:rubredoxin